MHLQKFQDEGIRQYATAAQVKLTSCTDKVLAVAPVMLLGMIVSGSYTPPHAGWLHAQWVLSCPAHLCTPMCVITSVPWQGLAESCADEVAGRAVQRQNALANLHNTVQHRQDRTAQQIATHQVLVDRQARRCT